MDPKVVGGYIRVSTQEQSTKGLSLETQTTEIEEYCKLKGFQLAGIYVDKGITARKDLYKRTGFMQMMEDVQDKKINHIVVLRLDRFFRNVYDYHRMMNEFLVPNGCGWSAIKEEYDTTTTNGRLMINLRLSIAEQECDQDSDRIKDVFANRIKEGYVVCGDPPFGMNKTEDKRLEYNEDAVIVKDIFDTMIATGSARKTMFEINKKYGRDFKYNRIVRILRNEWYTGKRRDNDHYCETLIDRATFDRAQFELTRNTKARMYNKNRLYIFSSLLICDECKKKMSGVTSTRLPDIRYYRCNYSNIQKNCNNKNHIRESAIEEYLLNNVEDLLKDYVIQFEAKEKEAAIVKGNREKIKAKIDRLTDLFINGMIDMDELKKRKAELESQIVDDKIPKKKDLTKVNELLNSGFKNIYYDLSADERKSLWRSVIKEIHICGKEIKSVIFL